MPLQIFVEDQLNDAYEVLARRALGLPDLNNRRSVKASIVKIDDLTSLENLLDLTQRSQQAGYDCIIFIMDQEATPTSADRPQKLTDFKNAFIQLCHHLDQLPNRNPLKQMKVTRIVCLRCLEGWLVSDPQAVIDAMRGSHGINIHPNPARTELLTPHQAAERIAHLIRQVGQVLNNRDLLQASAGNIKRRGRIIAQKVDLARARGYNKSLDYFCDRVQCVNNGCENLCPELDDA